MTEPDECLVVVYRADRTYDFRFAGGLARPDVVRILRAIADQIEQGADVPNPAATG